MEAQPGSHTIVKEKEEMMDLQKLQDSVDSLTAKLGTDKPICLTDEEVHIFRVLLIERAGHC